MATDDAIFQEDGASKPVKKIKAELGIVPMKWPPYSPDLKEAVTAVWNNVAFETTLQFIDSILDRVKEVIKKKGCGISW
ncbi:9765_t:CDS:2 [Racocetra persica]|uniref:9765_t:CDS:1 n=1 Tax=Racocetra persica TaxID=160502 RepID=A0ACA9MFE0_9GLOM|nr:9765_t:CDS:2 [Racocetra persica]